MTEAPLPLRASSPTKRPPALSDIAAKLKIEDKLRDRERDANAPVLSPDAAALNGARPESPTKGARLPAAGRLNAAAAAPPPPHPSKPTPIVVAEEAPVASTKATPAAAGVSPASTPASVAINIEAAQSSLGKSAPSTVSSEPRRTASGAPKPDKPKLHPLQHIWSLYFDSKSMQNNSAAPSPNPGTAAAAAAGATADKSPQQQQAQSKADPKTPAAASSTLQLPTRTPAAGTGAAASPRPPSSALSSDSWEAQLKFLGKYNTVEAFFKTFATLRRPSSLDRNSNYHLFKDGIKPMWEDPANAAGGKWVLTLRGTNPALLDRTWMWLVLALIGEDLDDHNHVTGAVCSTRPKADRIALWIRIKDDVARVNAIGRKFVELLDVEREPGVSLEFVSNSEGRRGSAYRSHGGHHNNMREDAADKSVDAATAAPAAGGVAAASESDTSTDSKDAGVTPSKESGADADTTSKGDESTGSIIIKDPATAPPLKYISFSNPPPQIGPGQGAGLGGGGGGPPFAHGPGGPFHHLQQQQQQHAGGRMMPVGPGGMPAFAGGMPGMGHMPFPPGFLPPGMMDMPPPPQQMGGMPPGMFPNGGSGGGPPQQQQQQQQQLSPQYLAAAGIAPQNMHYLQHQLALQQQAYMAQAQQMMAAQQQHHHQQGHQHQQQQHHHPGHGQRHGPGGGHPGSAFGTSPDKSSGMNALSTSPSKFGSSSAGTLLGRRGSEMGIAGGGAFGAFAVAGRRGSENPAVGSSGSAAAAART